MRRASHTINNVKGTGGGLAHNKHMYARLQLMYNITHNSVSAEELGMVVGEGRNRANHSFKFRTIGLGAVTAQLHGSFVARTVPEWNRLPAAAADAASTNDWMLYRSTSGPTDKTRHRSLVSILSYNRFYLF